LNIHFPGASQTADIKGNPGCSFAKEAARKKNFCFMFKTRKSGYHLYMRVWFVKKRTERKIDMTSKKKSSGLKKRGMLALSMLLIAALVIPQAALATEEAASDPAESAQTEDQSGKIWGGGRR
jgi:hypothetical protein